MSLALYLVAAGSLDATSPGDVIVLDGPEGRHAVTVRRTQPGERLRLADGAGRVVTGEVESVERAEPVAAGRHGRRRARARTPLRPRPGPRQG